MPCERLIIDGYSLIHRDHELKHMVNVSLRRARELLIEKISRTATGMAETVTIVFDGQQDTGVDNDGTHAVEILYSSSGQTADTVIERLVQQARHPSRWMVVTNDRRERETVMAAGVQTMSCAVFLEESARMQQQYAQSIRRQTLKQPGPKLGDFFPK